MEDQNYGVFRVGQLCNIDLKELMQRVVEEKVDVTITFEPDRTEISVTPWRLTRYRVRTRREHDHKGFFDAGVAD